MKAFLTFDLYFKICRLVMSYKSNNFHCLQSIMPVLTIETRQCIEKNQFSLIITQSADFTIENKTY